MSESRDEREFTADLELRTPTWLPGGKFAIRFNRLWDKRASNFIKQTAQAANVDEETLLRRADEGDGFSTFSELLVIEPWRTGTPQLMTCSHA